MNEAADRVPFKTNEFWAKLVTVIRRTLNPHVVDDRIMPDGRIHPYHAIREAFSSLDPRSIVYIDGEGSSGWVSDLVRISKPSKSFFTPGCLGTLWSEFGCALGSAISTRAMFLFVGEGSELEKCLSPFDTL
jgi:thiamine pyrophosphate-dependent acetolactate synthase large subunit-like protein